MSLSVGTDFHVNDVKVMTTSGRGLNPEELTEMILPKILFIGPDVPDELRAKAEAGKERLRVLLTEAFRVAQRSERTTVFNELMRADHEDAAELIRIG